MRLGRALLAVSVAAVFGLGAKVAAAPLQALSPADQALYAAAFNAAQRGDFAGAEASLALRDGIYELRASFQGIHYRMLYFFHVQLAVVVSHGLAKEDAVPPREIELAIRRKGWFDANLGKHTFKLKE